MRFVAAYYLAQKPLKDGRAPRGSAASRLRGGARLPVTRWLAVLRPERGTARSSQPTHTAQVSRNTP